MTFAKIIAWAFGIIYLVLGIVFSIRLRQMQERMGTNFGREGLVDSLAVYGGLHLAIGIFILICAVYELYGIGLLLGLLVSVGLSCIRIISMITHRVATTMQLMLLAPEIVGVVLAAIALGLLPSIFGLAS